MNLEPETRNGYLISADMKKVWAVEMELLKKLLEVCKKYNLKIWAEGGTLLGAIRHHGYIPWDDDIDMAMPREDYDKLQAIAKDEFKAPFFFQSGYTDLFPNGMTRLRMDGTAAIFDHTISQKYHQGIFIDIFPLDAMPDDEQERKKMQQIVQKEHDDLKQYCNIWLSFTDFSHNLKMIKLWYRIRKKGFKKSFKRYDDNFRNHAQTNWSYISLFSWFDNKRYIREKKWYSGTIYMPFEDMQLPVPKDYDLILKTQYGDYMKPVKAPTVHGNYVVLDAEKSYQEHLHILRKQHMWDKWKTRIQIMKKLFHLK